MAQFLLYALLASLGINIIMFVIAYKWRTDRLTDISYAATFVTLAILGLLSQPVTTSRIILSLIITMWAIRLGGFLLMRIWRTGIDHRFDDMRDSFRRFGKFWLLQGITVWVIMLPALLALRTETFAWSTLAFVGAAVWLVGLYIETTADLQKYRFSQNPQNKDKWIENGIWKYSRHPNYFGEILVWIGVYFVAFTALDGVWRIIGLASPLFIITLLLFVSGIPPLEKSADKRWGNDPKYRAYKKRTSVLVPLPLKR